MRGKLMFITGVGVGYVLGTRAGRERFDQMVAQARRVWESPSVQEAAGVFQAQVNRLYDQGRDAFSAQVHRLGARHNGTHAHRHNSGASGYDAGDEDQEVAWGGAERRSNFPAKSF